MAELVDRFAPHFHQDGSGEFAIQREFYAFTKSLETYEATMDPSTVFILGTDSELLRFLRQPR